jgi:hypothetical protein
MKVGVMQPYLFPYLGYFQLINAVDKFVIYDDVQYIKRGWINRNNVLCNGSAHMFVFSINKDHQYKNINERFYTSNFEKEKEKFLSLLNASYKKAPYFNDIYELIERIFACKEKNVSVYNTYSLREICNYIGVDTEFLISSEIEKEAKLKGQEKILAISKALGADWYINPIGGVELYSHELFNEENIKLNFIKMRDIRYKQFGNEFVPYLSIIDVLMFNSKERVRVLLDEYDLI